MKITRQRGTIYKNEENSSLHFCANMVLITGLSTCSNCTSIKIVLFFLSVLVILPRFRCPFYVVVKWFELLDNIAARQWF